ADRNRSHWSTSKTPSYTKSVSWQHHRSGVGGVKIAEAFPEGRDSRGRRRLAAPCALPAPFNLYGEAH
ncbi:hypothetical protein, partial [Escherichia coli]|uniref:hypothetical protein n=1 Tax=Escherichia coli TaxID=562 RepID=UPI001A7E05E3